MKVSANGVFGSGVTRTTSIGAAKPYVGVNPDETNMGYRGYIRELEVFVGTALHFEDFTPPTAPFIDTANSVGAPTENAQIFDYVNPV